MASKHKEKQGNTLRRMRLKRINEIVNGIPTVVRSGGLEEWEAWFERGKTEVANLIRKELGGIPKGYNEIVPSIKTQAKDRFVAWREMQAKGEWKTLSEEEQARWVGYVENGVPYETIRGEEMSRG
jgi:hypothetical protein